MRLVEYLKPWNPTLHSALARLMFLSLNKCRLNPIITNPKRLPKYLYIHVVLLNVSNIPCYNCTIFRNNVFLITQIFLLCKKCILIYFHLYCTY